ncbi:FAST kinase domain-containing protein 5, mitochondrial-like [Pollicipes pollicipes]|uniref:FAST kinase domain-containing protein 5, mitochondrial-like n=1 Tax=Pollicipes pollicipes TaxID=41117 RepID=UPI001884E1D8|nr:FAST kinase domain-containing protein 5, mitochondrial-like [Pollicipes pollicipes]XP_037087136.1 FAST kinase domain-containing protein 5, mitochondrial-like [Pollicipes pollicipes]XP_037087137.1 FAST kinase domain-containing protein 5, mitochondrial-like [Pollicipes pollicipes]
MASHRAWLSAAQLSRQFFNSARYVRPNSVVPDSSDRSAPAHPAVSPLLPLFTCVPPPPLAPPAQHRCLSTYLPPGKKFREGENEFAHEVMSGLPAYRRTLHYHVLGEERAAGEAAAPGRPAGWGAQAAHSLVSALSRLSVSPGPAALPEDGAPETDGALAARCSQYSDDQIVRLLAALLSWPPSSQLDALSFRRLWQALDVECCRRLARWDADRTLLVADLWYRLQVSRLTRYSGLMLERLGRQLRQLTPAQLVQYLFFVNLSRRLGSVKQFDLERKILECLPMLSVDELGIICMSFFKTRTPLRSDELVDAIVYKLLHCVETAKPKTVCAILKLLRLSVPAKRWQVLERVYDRLLPLADGFNSMVQLHLLLLGTQALVHHPASVVRITAHLHGQLATIRLKDIERLLFTTMLFNFNPGEVFFRDVVSELRAERRADERRSYPKCLMSCLMYLAFHGVHPADLIGAVVSPAFVAGIDDAMLSSYRGLERELTALSCTLELELPGFTSQLPQRYQQNQLVKHMARLPRPGMSRLTFAETTLLAVRAALLELLGSEDWLAIMHVLPHFVTPDVVVRLGEDGAPLPLPAAFLSQPAFSVKRPPPDTGLWCCIVVGGRSCYTRNYQHPVGNFLMRLRQLRRVGYAVVEVPWYEFQDKTHRVNYLRRKLQRLSVPTPPAFPTLPTFPPPPLPSAPRV